MKERIASAHMRSAFIYADLSYCERRKVGCVIVKNDRIISIGYNGTPSGWDNCCEDKQYMTTDAPVVLDPKTVIEQWPHEDEIGRYRLVTKPEVNHAELNAIAKLAASNESGQGASVFITHSPCIDCARLLSTIGIKEVYYAIEYAASSSIRAGLDGLEHLKSCKIPTYHLPINNKQ